MVRRWALVYSADAIARYLDPRRTPLCLLLLCCNVRIVETSSATLAPAQVSQSVSVY